MAGASQFTEWERSRLREPPNSEALLTWYDRHAREMPWRVGPAQRRDGQQPDPYKIWLSEVMLQQTTVAAVKAYFLRFTSRWPTVTALAAAEDGDVMAAWAGLGYYARARNLLKCARTVVTDHDGAFPTSREALLSLPGIGPYTASAIASIAFDNPETVVDGNVERVMARLYDIHTPLPSAKPELTQRARGLTPNKRPGDYAQAVMDLGATLCTPRSPACGICPWHTPCVARSNGTQAALPKKTPKKPKPIRYGIAYIARRADGAYLLERRPANGPVRSGDQTRAKPRQSAPRSWQTGQLSPPKPAILLPIFICDFWSKQRWYRMTAKPPAAIFYRPPISAPLICPQ